jgi:hypothetical protein
VFCDLEGRKPTGMGATGVEWVTGMGASIVLSLPPLLPSSPPPSLYPPNPCLQPLTLPSPYLDQELRNESHVTEAVGGAPPKEHIAFSREFERIALPALRVCRHLDDPG